MQPFLTQTALTEGSGKECSCSAETEKLESQTGESYIDAVHTKCSPSLCSKQKQPDRIRPHLLQLNRISKQSPHHRRGIPLSVYHGIF